jgi:hypothetical protein
MADWCRLDINDPPTSVGGIRGGRVVRCVGHVISCGWDLSDGIRIGLDNQCKVAA